MESEKEEMLKETNSTPIFSEKETQAIGHLFGKVCFFAIYKIRFELHLAWKNEIPGEQYQCDCLSRLNFGLPCQHMMKADGPAVDLQYIPSRWFLDYNRGIC